jgi:hypothetical protein
VELYHYLLEAVVSGAIGSREHMEHILAVLELFTEALKKSKIIAANWTQDSGCK